MGDNTEDKIFVLLDKKYKLVEDKLVEDKLGGTCCDKCCFDSMEYTCDTIMLGEESAYHICFEDQYFVEVK